jgi:hypothetical protein
MMQFMLFVGVENKPHVFVERNQYDKEGSVCLLLGAK